MFRVISTYSTELNTVEESNFYSLKSEKFVNSCGNIRKTSHFFVDALVCVGMSFTLNCSGDIASELKG